MKCSVLQSNGIAYECIGTGLPRSWFIVLHVQHPFYKIDDIHKWSALVLVACQQTGCHWCGVAVCGGA